MLPTKETIRSYHIYTYTFLDDLSCIKNPYSYFEFDPKEKIDDAIHLIKERFLEYGWEGDGAIGIIWLPPFVDVGVEDTWGTYVWHVKQRNNGISFLACDHPLDFKRLREQNEEFEVSYTKKGLIPVSIIQTCVNWFIESVDRVENELKNSILYLSENTKSDITNSIKKNLNTHSQGTLVRYFQEFLVECYLQFLIEVIDNGNPHKIKLRKSQVKLDTFRYLPEPDSDDEEESITSASTWFTLKGLITDMWKAYKWEPFKNKTDMLFRSIDYKPDQNQIDEIMKHLILRNCVQHHKGCLDRDSLDQLGCKNVQMKGDSGTYTIEVWKPILICEHEIYSFCKLLKEFVDNFHEYVKKRVPTVHYMSKKT